MNDYLYNDVYSIKSNLKDMLHNSKGILSNTSSMAQSLNKLDMLMEKGFSGVISELSDISYLLEDMLNMMIDFRHTTFIQNEQRNQLLASIDATLKAPNKTAANEKYEISIELAGKNKHETAIQFLKDAIELNPLHYRSYIQLTLNLLKMQNYQEALYYAKESINFAPNNNEILAYTYSLVARASEKMKDFKGALNNINQTIRLNNRANYTYERARYFAFLGDVSKSMTELKKAIEMDSEYFSISLVDSAFLPYRKEREKFLTSLKEEIESKLNYEISKMEVIQFHKYTFEVMHDYDYDRYISSITLDYFEREGTSIDLKDFTPKIESLSVKNIDGQWYWYNYNGLLKHFFEKYNHIVNLHHNKLPLVKELKISNTYAAFRESYNEILSYKNEYNHFIISMRRFLNDFKEISMSAEQILRLNLEHATEVYNKAKKQLQSEKRRKSLSNVFVFLLISIRYNSLDIKILEKICINLEDAVRKIQIGVENETKHKLAIQRLVNEVLIERPLPNTID